jgi:hypothetical protein
MVLELVHGHGLDLTQDLQNHTLHHVILHVHTAGQNRLLSLSLLPGLPCSPLGLCFLTILTLLIFAIGSLPAAGSRFGFHLGLG